MWKLNIPYPALQIYSRLPNVYHKSLNGHAHSSGKLLDQEIHGSSTNCRVMHDWDHELK